MATAKTIDMTNVKDGGGQFNKRHFPPGDYPGRVTKVADAAAKEGGDFMWLFTIATDNGGTYPLYCKLTENQLWKVRNLCLAAGMQVPKKKLKLDPEKLVGKRIAVTLEDDEYDGKLQSVVQATFPLSELGEYAEADDSEDDSDDDDDGEDEEVAPPPAKKSKKAKPAPVEEDEDDEEDEEDEPATQDAYAGMDRKELKEALAILDEDFKVKKSMTDDDLRAKCRELDAAPAEDDEDDEDDAPPPPKKKAKAKAKAKVEVDDDELEELDIDDL